MIPSLRALARPLSITLFALVLSAALAPVRAAPPPAAAFFGPEPLTGAALSPSGRWLATTVRAKEGRVRLVVSDLEDKEPARVVAMFSRVDVDDVVWVDEDWLVFDTLDVVNRAHRSRGAGLMAVRRDGERIRLLIKRELDTLFQQTGAGPLEANHWMLRRGAPGTREIIVGSASYDVNGEYSHMTPLALDVSTGERRSLAGNFPDNGNAWWFDAQGRPRAVSVVKGEEVLIYWNDPVRREWKVIGRYPRLEVGMIPRFIDENDQLWVETNDENGHSVLSRFDFTTGKPGAPRLASTPGFDGAIGVIQDRRTGAAQALSLVTDARQQIWLTPTMKAVQDKVEAMLPGRVNWISCGDCEAPKTVLVVSSSDRNPADYLLYTPATDQWQRLGNVRPEIDPKQMARLSFDRIKARDGADLPVWITRDPAGDAQPRPAVVLVHGGPWVRGVVWGWDAEAQFLASRGYVVIEPEFRGSTGYGDAHYRAGWRQWGMAMQDDVTDALRHAVARRWVDPKRVCILGASYGGYSALMGVAKDPDQYRCAVAWAAVTDPRLMFSIHWSDTDEDEKRHSLPDLVGDPVKDAAMLAANAPLELAAKIKAPVLLAHGNRDVRVPIEHGERMRDALQRAGNPPEWVMYDGEGHGWRRPENVIDFWQRVEAFLGRHLK